MGGVGGVGDVEGVKNVEGEGDVGVVRELAATDDRWSKQLRQWSAV